MIKIVNYGSGNIQAILNIYKQLNIDCFVASTPEELSDASKLILPGVGAFDETMQELLDSGFQSELDRLVLEKGVPVMGICVGMQILAKSSDEGGLPGLGYIDGHVKKFDSSLFTQKPHIPHLGWNSIDPTKEHPTSLKDRLASTHYGLKYSSAVHHNNVYGMQFHPEKSHSNGVQLFKNFANL